MSSLNDSKYSNFDDFFNYLVKIEQSIQKSSEKKPPIDINNFIELNKEYFNESLASVLKLDSIAVKLRQFSKDEPLIETIRKLTQEILPGTKLTESLKKNLINQNEFISVADWVNLMEIPLVELQLTQSELEKLFPKLEYIDIRGLNFEEYDVKTWVPNFDHLSAIRSNGTVEEQTALVTIAKECVNRNSWTLVENIQKFQIKNEEELIEIAKDCAKKNCTGTAANIQNFQVKSEEGLIAIAKECAKNEGYSTAAFIKRFVIKNEEALIAIAKECAKQSGIGTAQYIQNFQIKNEEGLIAIAKECAKQSGGGTAQYIQNFQIKSEEALIDIAKECAKQSGGGTAQYIQNFQIKSEEALIDIAKECAKQSGGGIAQYIQNFHIKSEEALIAIANECAKQDGGGTAAHIQKFEIKREEVLIEIAKECAKQDGGQTTAFIKKFEIKREEVLIEIAKECAKQDGGGTAQFIGRFQINNEEALIAIAKECAKQDGARTALNIQNFQIKSEEGLVAIAEECAKEDGYLTARYIGMFGIQDEKARRELFFICIRNNIKSIDCVDEFSISSKEIKQLSKLNTQVFKRNDELASQRKELYRNIDMFVDTQLWRNEAKVKIKEVSKSIAELPPHIQQTAGYWLLGSLYLMTEMDNDGLDWILHHQLWDTLGSLHNPELRSLLTGELFELGKNKEYRDLWIKNISEITSGVGKQLMLLVIPFYPLYRQGVGASLQIELFRNLENFQKKKKSKFRDANVINSLLHTIHLLASNHDLSDFEKTKGLEKIFYGPNQGEEEVLKNTVAARRLLQLKDNKWPTSTEDMNELFRVCFARYIPLGDFKGDVSKAIESTFDASRKPEGILTYAAGLTTLKEPKLLNCLGQYVRSVFEGTFKDQRYETKNNSHLAKIFDARPDLLEKWKKNVSLPLDELSFGKKESDNFDSQKWLRTKLIIDKHLEDTDLFYIKAYLEADSDNIREQVFKSINGEIQKKYDEIGLLNKNRQNEMDLKKINELRNAPALENLKLQSSCLKLARNDANKKELVTQLNNIDKLIQNKKSEFRNDIKGVIETLEKSPNPKTSKAELKVVISDDPMDLLLCGTDVSGSCQRLEGSPKLNKGLLSYIVDGKNMLVAIKDGDRIIARCILRLMWDGVQPVLFRERFYPDVLSENECNAINHLVKQRAHELGVPVTSADYSKTQYKKSLESLGGPAPYEYVDACGGLQKEGCFTLRETYLME